MKRVCYRFVTTALLVGWMLVIFLFSAQPSAQSSQVSGGVSCRLVTMVSERFHLNLTEERENEIAAGIEYPVRKAAHMTEYAIMGLLCFSCYASFGKSGRKCYLAAFFTAVCYAATDEIHQLFVPGRSGMVMDVCVDAAGVFLGLLFLRLLLKIVRKHCEKKILPIQ